MKIHKIYQNVGSARLSERAVLVLDHLSVSSAKSVVNPFCVLGSATFQNSSFSAKLCLPRFLSAIFVSLWLRFFSVLRAFFHFSSPFAPFPENFRVNSLPLVAALPRCASVVSSVPFRACCPNTGARPSSAAATFEHAVSLECSCSRSFIRVLCEIRGRTIPSLRSWCLCGFISPRCLAVRRCCFGYRFNSSKSFFSKSCSCLQSFRSCLQFVLGDPSSSANPDKNPCYG